MFCAALYSLDGNIMPMHIFPSIKHDGTKVVSSTTVELQDDTFFPLRSAVAEDDSVLNKWWKGFESIRKNIKKGVLEIEARIANTKQPSVIVCSENAFRQSISTLEIYARKPSKAYTRRDVPLQVDAPGRRYREEESDKKKKRIVRKDELLKLDSLFEDGLLDGVLRLAVNEESVVSSVTEPFRKGTERLKETHEFPVQVIVGRELVSIIITASIVSQKEIRETKMFEVEAEIAETDVSKISKTNFQALLAVSRYLYLLFLNQEDVLSF